MRPVRIFKDRSKLLPGYVPERLVNREDEFRELVRFFKTTLTGEVGQRVLIHGPSGAGKTALARRFARELERVAEGKGTRMRHVYVDCRAQRSEFRVARKMAVSLGLKVPPTGISARQCLDRTAGFLEGKDSHLALVLDWLDFHVREEGADLLYTLTRMWENSEGPNRISVIGVSRSPDVTRLLDRASRSSFLHNRLELGQYSAQQLREILDGRVDLAFGQGAVRKETVELISRDAPWQDGAGFALEWLYKAGLEADREGEDRVTPRHALRAKAHVHVRAAVGSLKMLGEHELLVLLALAKKLRGSDRSSVRTGELEEKYGEICEALGAGRRGHVTFLERVKRLSALGIVEMEPSGKGQRGGTHEIRVPGNSAEVLAASLEHFLKKRERF